MPFKKGQSGNPKGQAPNAANKRRIAADMLAELLPRAKEVYREMLYEDENKGFAAKEIFDRVCGKAPQALDIGGEDGGPITLVIKDI